MMKALIFVSAMCLLSMVNSLQIHDAHWGHCEKDGFWAHPNNCNWFVFCENGEIQTGECEEWEYFDPELVYCVPRDQFKCHHDCPDVDGVSFIPSPESCEEYYICVNRQPYNMRCRPGFHWNQDKEFCDHPDTANCVFKSHPEELPDCRPGFPYIKPHPRICNFFVKCSENGLRTIQQCPHLYHFDMNQEKCLFMRNAICTSD